jgi:catechol 2,3-dioxygenase-like lactoylglutathione lyase family enzyme
MVEMNHAIVWCSNKVQSSTFFAEILGLNAPEEFGHFLVVRLANDVSLDFMQKEGPVAVQHYAFLISDAEFDDAFRRIQERRINFWADHAFEEAGQINRHWGGRGVYFNSPDGHVLELITRPYGRMEDI